MSCSNCKTNLINIFDPKLLSNIILGPKNYFQHKYFWDKNCFHRKIHPINTLGGQKKLQPNNFSCPYFFLDKKILIAVKTFRAQHLPVICLDQEIFQDHNLIGDPKFCFDPISFLDQTIFRTKCCSWEQTFLN